jgi:class 3 adenylate cyclase
VLPPPRNGHHYRSGARIGRLETMAHPVVVVKQEGRRPLYVEIRDTLEIGRECDGILLCDPQASRRHATLTPRGAEVVVEDLRSTNGTLLDGAPITAPVVLAAGSVVRVGDTVLQLAAEGVVTRAANVGAAPGTVAVAAGTSEPLTAVRAATAGPVELRETSMESVARAVGHAPPSLQGVQADSGTVTIVFSDIESSTERATAVGDAAWMKVLNAHNEIIRRHTATWQGTIVKNQGDGFMVTFGGARRALRAMIEVQRELRVADLGGIRIRVGVHTGEVISEEGDIFGKHVMIAARVGGLAGGGEVLVSSIVREIASARGDLDFGEARAVRLKGIEGEHLVFPLLWEHFVDED